MRQLSVFFLLIIFINLFISCKNNTRVEEDFMRCTYAAFSDNGRAIKKLMINYENTLISDDILNGASGSDYIKLLKRLSEGNLQELVASDSFIYQFQKMDNPDQNKIFQCQELILQDTTRYRASKFMLLENTLKGVEQSGDFDPTLIAKATFEILDKDDLELDFYKMRVFILMDAMLVNADIYPVEND